MYAKKSPIEFPHAKSVKARMIGEIPESRPNSYSKSMMTLTMIHIQKMDMTNACTEKTAMILELGAVLYLVLNLIKRLMLSATKYRNRC